MRHKPSEENVHDKYYGGFARYLTINNDWSQPMNIGDLYDFIGLKMLAETYDSNRMSYNLLCGVSSGNQFM